MTEGGLDGPDWLVAHNLRLIRVLKAVWAQFQDNESDYTPNQKQMQVLFFVRKSIQGNFPRISHFFASRFLACRDPAVVEAGWPDRVAPAPSQKASHAASDRA